MLRFYLPRVCKTTNFLFNRDTTTALCVLETPFHSKFLCANNATESSSFTELYLIKSCGFPEEKAVSVSKKMQLKSSLQPDTVLTFFRNHEFPNLIIFKIIEKHPTLLLSNADKTLKPKIEFFKSLGFSGPDLAKMVVRGPIVLRLSLENRIRPAVDFLKSILPAESNIITVIKRSPWLFELSPLERLAPKVALLRSHGAPDCNIVKLLLLHPNIFTRTKRFNAIVEEIMEMQFDPSKYAFVRAVGVLASMTKQSWEAKTSIYKSWGWSDNHIRMAFRKQPQCMMQSKKKIMGCMEFIVKKMGYDSLLIAKYPLILTYSLEMRITPRLSVIQLLISNNLVERDCNINTALLFNDKAFVKKFVKNFEQKLPQLLDVFEGKRISL